MSKSVRITQWLPVLNQGATYLGLAMIALVWLGFDFHMKAELATVQQDAIQHASNLSRAFEEHLVTTLSGLDHTLQVVRAAYERNPDRFDLIEWAKQEHALSDPAFQIVLIGPDGHMRATTAGSPPARLDLSDREHFRVHVDASDDNLFISKPLIGRVGASLFALGIVEAGMVACVTISISSAYAFGEVASRPHSLNLPIRQGKAFYSMIFLLAALAASIVLIPGLPLVYVVLVVNVIAVLAMPPALVFLFMLVNDKELMAEMVSPRWANAIATAVVVFLTAAGVLFGISVVAPNLFAALGGK